MKKLFLVCALGLSVLLLVPAPLARADDDNNSSDNGTFATLLLTAGFTSIQTSLATTGDPNAQAAFNLAFFAQFYASVGNANSDSNAFLFAFFFGGQAAQLSFNSYLTTKDPNALVAYIFLYIGSLFAFVESNDLSSS
jgi:hypothetical protein